MSETISVTLVNGEKVKILGGKWSRTFVRITNNIIVGVLEEYESGHISIWKEENDVYVEIGRLAILSSHSTCLPMAIQLKL